MRDLGLEILGQALSRVLAFDGQVPPSVTTKGLRYQTKGQMALDLPALQIKGRGITAILGANGAGKSLLVRLLHGLIKPDVGDVLCGDLPVFAGGRDRQAMVFQDPVLLRRSVIANLKFALKFGNLPKADRPAALEALLEIAGLTGREHQSARTLSGGEKQCLALACALARQPKVLFLDEPTSSLDPSATQRIEMILHQAATMGVRIVMVTHDLPQAKRLADEVIFVSKGRIEAQQSARAFFDAPNSAQAQAYLAGQLVY